MKYTVYHNVTVNLLRTSVIVAAAAAAATMGMIWFFSDPFGLPGKPLVT